MPDGQADCLCIGLSDCTGRRYIVGAMKKVRILMYNNIGSYPEPAMEDAVSAECFAGDMAWLVDNGYRIVPLAEVLALADGPQPIPDNLLALTFDGGYADVPRHVLPVLTRLGLPATFFIPVSSLGKSLTVYGERIPCMGWPQVHDIAAAGFDIGAYLLGWQACDKSNEVQLITEIHQVADVFRDKLDRPLRYVSVREGVPGKAVRSTLKEVGIEAFLTKCPTKYRTHRYAIGRIQIDDEDPNIFRIKLSNNYLRFKDSRSWRYIRKYKVDRLAHLISDIINRRRGVELSG